MAKDTTVKRDNLRSSSKTSLFKEYSSSTQRNSVNTLSVSDNTEIINFENFNHIYKPTPKLYDKSIHFNYDDFKNIIFHDSHLWCYKNQIRTTVGILAICLNVGKQLPYRKLLPNAPPMIIGGVVPVAYEGSTPAMFPPSYEKELRDAYLNLFLSIQPRVRYILNIDPTEKAIEQIYTNCNKSYNNERIFFYYNGYGVPDPDPDGTLYLSSYNSRGFETFEKISLRKLYLNEKTISLTILDCSFAGYVLESLLDTSSIDNNDNVENAMNDLSVFLGATEGKQLLPLIPELPTDIFTMCLTAPIEISTILYQFHSAQEKDIPFNIDNVKKIPGVLNDRSTLLGEINWIFTTIIDTIAYATLPLDNFLKLYRGDLLLATVMRNFILAKRLLAPFGCKPVSYPELPTQTQHHYLWQLWDYHFERTMIFINQSDNSSDTLIHNDFFINQLRSFNHWLQTPGNEHLIHSEYLTQALQFLLGQSLRTATLKLICHYFDLGLWAIKKALSIGMFTYLIKLFNDLINNDDLTTLDSNKLRQSLFLWCKLTFFEPHYHIELLNAEKYHFFMFLLRDNANEQSLDLKIIVVYIITRLIEDPIRREEALNYYGNNLFQTLCEVMNKCFIDLNDKTEDRFNGNSQSEAPESIILNLLYSNSLDNLVENRDDPITHLLLLWTILCLGIQCENNPTTQQKLLRQNIFTDLNHLLYDDDPQLRSAVVYLLGNLITQPTNINDNDQFNDERIISLVLDMMGFECSTMVKKEIMIAIHKFISKYHDRIKLAAFELSSNMNVGIIQLLFDSNTLQRLTHDKLKSFKKLFHSTLIDIIYNDKEPTGNVYIRIFKCAMRLLVDSTHEILKTTRLFMSIILPFELCMNGQDNINESVYTFTANYLINNHSLNFKRNHFDKLSESGPLLTLSNISVGSPASINKCTNSHAHDWDRIFADRLPSCISYRSNMLISDLIFRCSTFFMQPIMHNNVINYRQRKEIFQIKSQCESNWETFKKCVSTSPLNKNNFSTITHIIYEPYPTYSTIKFHSFKPFLYLAQHNVVNIINWSGTSEIFKKIVNHSNKMVDITTIEIVNCDHNKSLLLTGSDDGVVKIWSLQNTKNALNCISGQISSWKALPFFVYTQDLSPALTSAWNQRTSTLCVGGWSDRVYCWDLNVERFSGSILNNSASSVTSMSFFETNSNTLVCSMGNGSMNVIDLRTRICTAHYCDIKPNDTPTFKNTLPYTHCKAFPSIYNDYHINFVNSSGSFLLYDIRQQQIIKQCPVNISNFDSCDYQSYHDRLVYQSTDGIFNIVNNHGNVLFKKTFTKGKPSKILATKFHPFMSVLALYTNDGSLSIVYTDGKQDPIANSLQPIDTLV